MDNTDGRGAMTAATDGVRNVHTLRDATAAIQLAAKLIGEQLDELEGELMSVLRLSGSRR
jgi:hypothetical protein